LEELKAFACWERKTIKEAMDEVLASYFKRKPVRVGGFGEQDPLIKLY